MIELARLEGRMLRIGHRGAPALAPENTIRSLMCALELGCDLVELDVLELDGTLVLAHSPAELPEERATLEEALAVLAPTRAGIQVDLKTAGAEAAVAHALQEHGMFERSLVSSFLPESLRALKALAPGLRLGLTYPPGVLAAMRPVLAKRIERMLERAQANVAVLHWRVVSRAVVRRCHELGVPVLAWTVVSEQQVKWLDELGVDGVIVDDPRILGG